MSAPIPRLAGMDTPAPAGSAGHLDEIGRNIVAAAREEFVRFGIRRANVEEIARRAGVARVTVYRRFESKTALLQAVVLGDIVDFVGRFDAILYGDGSAQERIIDAFTLAVHELRRHPLLTTAMRSDPSAVTAALTLEGAPQFEKIKALLADRIARLAERGDIGAADPSRSAEFTLRLLYTVFLMPFGELPGRTDDEIRRFAQEYVVGLLIPTAGS